MNHDYVVGAFNTGSHWVLVIIAMKWNVVWYLDSSKGFPLRKFKDVVTVVNWAYSEYIDPKMKKNQKTNLNSHTRQISRALSSRREHGVWILCCI